MRRNHLFLIIALFLSMSCAEDKPLPVSESVVTVAQPPQVCTMESAQQQLLAKHQGFEAQIIGDTIVLAKNLKGADGQKLGGETHSFTVDADAAGSCTFTECESSREVSGKKLVNLFCEKKSRYYENGGLVYEDSALKDGLWLRKYANLDKVPTKSPNWASPDGLDLYMTYVARSEQNASRVPVWGVQAVWQKEGDDFTLMAGEVLLKNPEKGVQPEEVYTVLRTNAQGEVTLRGILYPVSTSTFNAYLGSLQSKKPDGWERDHSADSEAMLAFFDGPVKYSKSRREPLDRVFARRGTQPSRLPSVDADFLPGFDKNPRLH